MIATIVGAQLGDEGKGGVVDAFGANADVVVRYQGGDNAGHTVVNEGEEYKLSLVPSGAVRGKRNVLGNGCVVNLETLFEEMDTLRDRGLDPDVRVAERAHIILPSHRILDGIEEDAKDDLAAATTGRGIGPTYEDKAARRGIRIGDLVAPDALRNRLSYLLSHHRSLLEDVYDASVPEVVDLDHMYEQCRDWGRRLEADEMLVDAGTFLAEQHADGADIMFEGAQGTALDIDHGIYPYVTSSNASAGGVCTGTGFGPVGMGSGEVIGIVKAYLSRVGTGPLPTEVGGVAGQTPGFDPDDSGREPEIAEYLREEGDEYGTVTGRPRRVGWLDLPMLRHANRVNSLTGIVVNHIDVLAGLDRVKMGETYQTDGETLETLPPTTHQWGRCEANFRTFDGWPDVDWEAVANDGYEAIPSNARTFLEYLSDELDVDIVAVGVGPGRSQTVVRKNPFA